MLNFIALPRSTVLVNIVILHFLQVTLLLMFQLVTFIILLNEIFLYSSAPLTSMAAPQPLAGGKDEMNSSLIRNNNNKNTHKAPSAFYFGFPFRGGGVPSPLPWAMKPGLGLLLAQLRWMDGGSPVPPPALACAEMGRAAGMSWQPSQSCPPGGKAGHPLSPWADPAAPQGSSLGARPGASVSRARHMLPAFCCPQPGCRCPSHGCGHLQMEIRLEITPQNSPVSGCPYK